MAVGGRAALCLRAKRMCALGNTRARGRRQSHGLAPTALPAPPRRPEPLDEYIYYLIQFYTLIISVIAGSFNFEWLEASLVPEAFGDFDDQPLYVGGWQS